MSDEIGAIVAGGPGSGPRPGVRNPWYERGSKGEKQGGKRRRLPSGGVPEPVRGRDVAPVVSEHRPARASRTTGVGTADDPIVTDSVEDAARALIENKHVRLNQPETVSTLLDKLALIGKDARAKGEKAPTYDLCKVSVPGTNLFCAESKGIPRVKMPQLSGTPLPGSPASKMPLDAQGEVNIGDAFREHLAGRGIKTTEKSMDASLLRATQDELNGVQVAGIMDAVLTGNFKADKPIFVTRDNYVIDGHHRWAAFVGAEFKGQDLDIPVIQVDMDIIDALGAAHAFADEMGIPRKDKTEISLASRRIAAAVAARREDRAEFGGPGSGPRPGVKNPWYDRGSKPRGTVADRQRILDRPGAVSMDEYERALSDLENELVAARPSLSAEEDRVVRSVASDPQRREEIFGYFRGDDVDPGVEAEAETLAAVLLKSRLPNDVTVHRGFDLTREQRKAKVLNQGSVFRLDEPLAAWVDMTALMPGGEVRFKGVASGGQPGLYVGDMRSGPGPSPEILFPPGTGVRVDVERAGSLVDGVVLPPPPAGEPGLSDRLQRVLTAARWAWIVIPEEMLVRDGADGSGYDPGMVDEIVDERIAAAVAQARAEFGGPGSGPRPGVRNPWYERGSKAKKKGDRPDSRKKPKPEASDRGPVQHFPPNYRYVPGSLDYDKVARMSARQKAALIDHIKTTTGSGGKDSQECFRVDGKYTPERSEFHRKVIERFVGHVRPPKGKPIATFLGGGPAAGKSTVLKSGQVDVPSDNEGKPPADAVLINADEVKAMIPEFRDLAWLGDDKAAGWAHEESSDVAKMVMAEGFKRGLNVNIDGTGDASIDKRKKEIDAARASGHVVNGVYVTVPTKMALERNQQRYEGAVKRKELARLVPREVVVDTHRGVSRVLPDLAPEFDSVQLFSTDVPRGERPIPIASTTRGKPLEIVNQGLWDGFLRKATEELGADGAVFAAATEGRGGDDLVVSMMVDILTGREFNYAPELRDVWDRVQASIDETVAAYPGAVLDVPGEFQSPVPQSEMSWSQEEWDAREAAAPKVADDRALRLERAWDVFGGPGSGPRPGVNNPWYNRGSKPTVPVLPADRGKPGVDRALFPGGLGPIKNPRTAPAVLPPARRFQPSEDVDGTADRFASAAPAMDGETREVLGRFVAKPGRVNDALRSGAGSGSDAAVLAEAAVLNSYLAKGSVPEDVVVYRSMQLTPEVADSIVPGATIQNPGFTSATLTPPGVLKGQPSFADMGNVRLEIFVPKGTKNAAYVSHELEGIGSLDREVLFGTDLNVRVDSVEAAEPDEQFPAERVVYASVVPSHSRPPSGVSRDPNFAVRREAALGVVLGPRPFNVVP